MSEHPGPVHAGGVYAAPRDVASLRTAFSGALDAWREVNLSAVRDKAGLLAESARALDFPSSFGGNWDAWADSLQDLSWLNWTRLVIYLRGAGGVSTAAPAEWRTALDILGDAANYWSTRGRTLLVLVEPGGRDMPSLTP